MKPSRRSGSKSASAPGAIERTFDVLDALARRRKAAFTELQRACPDMAKATLVRLLRSLTSAGMIGKNEAGRYTLGPKCVRFARTVLEVASRGEDIAPVVKALADATGESAAYFELDGFRLKLLCKTEKPNSFHYIPTGNSIGRAHVHIFTRVILAFRDETVARAVLAREKEAGPNDRKRVMNACRKIHASGLYVGPESGAVVTRVVAPVMGFDDTALGAIGITILGKRVGKKRLAECTAHVRDAAERARERALGGE